VKTKSTKNRAYFCTFDLRVSMRGKIAGEKWEEELLNREKKNLFHVNILISLMLEMTKELIRFTL
jgi:hypothetical protein